MATAEFLAFQQTVASDALFASVRAHNARRVPPSSEVVRRIVTDTLGVFVGSPHLIGLDEFSGLITVFGSNPDVDSGTVPESLAPDGAMTGWHGVAASDTLALEAVSASADDDVAGTGANYLVVSGIETLTGLPVACRFTLDGTTPVAAAAASDGTAIKFSRIQSARTYPRANVGAITIRAVDGGGTGTTVGLIPAATGVMNACWFHVPIGYVGEVVSVTAGCSGTSGTATVTLTLLEPEAGRTLISAGITSNAPYQSSNVLQEARALYTIKEFGTAILRATASSDNNPVYGTMTIRLVERSPKSATYQALTGGRQPAAVTSFLSTVRTLD
jgi:hypothetical protein